MLTDIAHAADLLRPVYDELDGADGFVSVEVSPDLAHDTQRHDRAGKRAVAAAGPPERDDQDPGHAEGIPAITETLAAGINVNITLIFSLARYAEVIEAFLAASSVGSIAATTSAASRRSRRSS